MSGLIQSPSYTPLGANAITRRFADKLKEFPSVRDWGVKGNLSTDDTVNMQRALDGTPDFGVLTIPVGCRMRITSALTLLNRTGITLRAECSAGGGADYGSSVSGFWWDGSTGGTMLNVHNVAGSRFQNLAFFSHMPSIGGIADCCVDIDQTASNPVTCTDLIWDRCTFQTFGARTQWNGVYISRVSISNCEVMRFWNCRWTAGSTNDATTYAGKGTCVHVGNSFNAKQIALYDCSFGNAGYGLYMETGSFSARRCSGYGVRTVYKVSFVDPSEIHDNQFEGCGQFADVTFNNAPLTISNCRFGALVTGAADIAFPWIATINPAKLFLVNNEWNDSPGQYLCTSNGQADLFAFGNMWPRGLLELGMASFNNYTIYDDTGVIQGCGAPYGFGGSYQIATHTGYHREVLNIPIQQNNIDVHYQPGHTKGNLVIGGGGIEIGGCGIPHRPTLNIVGTPNPVWTPTTYSLIALDSNGKRSMISAGEGTGQTPSPLSTSNYIALSWVAVPNAVSYDIVETSQLNSELFRLVANVVGTSYNIQANPSTSFGSYTLPTYNESATFGAMGAAPVGKQTLPAAATDAATTQALANSLRVALLNLGFGA